MREERSWLSRPLQLRGVTVPNRVVFCAHLTNQAVDRLPTAAHTAYYAARAAGGAGLVITEEQSVAADDRSYEKVVDGTDPAVVTRYAELTDAVHAHGTAVLAQLNHNGGQASSLYSRTPLLAPSPVPDPLFREVPRAATERDLAALVDGFGLVAGHCAAGGFDGVELQASQSSVLRAFLSPATNLRTDRWGGPLAGRARLLLAAVHAARQAIGPDRVLAVRLAGEELVAGGSTLDDAVALARLLAATGEVDLLNTTMGVATASLHWVEPSMAVPAGYALHVAAAIRAAVDLPVVGVGRITTPEQAEQALADGRCDLVGVVRGQIADPDWAVKALAGRDAEIRTCLSCNQECAGRMGRNRWLGCTTNPRAGRESVLLPPPGRSRRVVVVGGGPAGVRAALAAAGRGHRVTLVEAAPALGGQVLTAARAPGRAEFGALVRSAAADCARAGVEVRLGHRATAAELVAAAPDAVVLATGALPDRPGWAAASDQRVVDVRDVLEGRATPAGTVLLVDDVGFHPATSGAEELARRGCTVEVVTGALVVGQDLGPTLDLERWNARAAAAGITRTVERVVLGVHARSDGRRSVRLLHHPTGDEEVRVVDWVVAATHPRPDDALWHELAGSGLELHRVGDCLTPRRAHAATVEGARVGAAL